jgi:hypothetical protein
MYADIKRVAAVGDAEDHIKLVFTGVNGRVVDMEISGGVAHTIPEYVFTVQREVLSAMIAKPSSLNILTPALSFLKLRLVPKLLPATTTEVTKRFTGLKKPLSPTKSFTETLFGRLSTIPFATTNHILSVLTRLWRLFVLSN